MATKVKVINSAIALHPLNWVIVAIMSIFAMFALVQMQHLFSIGQGAVTDVVAAGVTHVKA